MKTENYSEELMGIGGIQIKIITYKIGEDFHCHVHNLEPGAVIARASSSIAEKAKEEALEKAKRRIQKNSVS